MLSANAAYQPQLLYSYTATPKMPNRLASVKQSVVSCCIDFPFILLVNLLFLFIAPTTVARCVCGEQLGVVTVFSRVHVVSLPRVV